MTVPLGSSAAPKVALQNVLPFRVAVGAVLAMASFVSYWRISVPPVLYDEPGYAEMGWRYVHWSSVPADLQSDSNFEHPPFAKFLFGLAQLVAGNESVTACRVLASSCVLLSGVLMAIWLGQVAGRWVGLLAGALIVLIPTPISPQQTGFARTAMLDPVAQLFMIASVVLAWHWFQCLDRQAWALSAWTGVLVGLAAASKENGFLGVVGPVAVGLLTSRRSSMRLPVRLLQATSAVVIALCVFVVTYLPLGQPFSRIDFLLSYQLQRQSEGHLIGYAGRVSGHPRWWANLWFAEHSLGPWVTAILSVGVVAALLLCRRRFTVWLAASLIAPLIFHCFVVGNALPFYWTMWFSLFASLAAVGISELVHRAAQPSQPSRRGAGVLAVALVLGAPLVVVVGRQMSYLVQMPHEGGYVVQAVRVEHRLDGAILMAGTYEPEISAYIGDQVPLLLQLPQELQGIDTVLVGQPRCRTLVDPKVRALVTVNVASGGLRLVHTDRLLRIYIRTGQLAAPSAAQVAAQPVGKLTDYC